MTAPASPPLTPEEIAELRRLHEEATPAPWAYDYASIDHPTGPPEYVTTVVGLETRGRAYVEYEVLVLSAADGALIARVRNALPRLLLAAERAEGLARALERLAFFEKRYSDGVFVVCRGCDTVASEPGRPPRIHAENCYVARALAAYRGSAGGGTT